MKEYFVVVNEKAMLNGIAFKLCHGAWLDTLGDSLTWAAADVNDKWLLTGYHERLKDAIIEAVAQLKSRAN